jgi:hypothetical protein
VYLETDLGQRPPLGDRRLRPWCAPVVGLDGEALVRSQAAHARLDQWAARPPIPDVLPGEVRTYGDGLFVDLIPRTCWFTDVRTCVSQQDWERLRRPIFRRAGYACEVCGATEDRESSR